MTQEERQKEKELLLNVLKDGLPYGLQLKITDINKFTFNGELCVLSKNWCRLNIADPVKRAKVKNQTIPLNSIYIKPYLRPLASMTEEEAKEIVILHGIKDILSIKLTDEYIEVVVDDGVCSTETRTIWYDEIISSIEIFDWLNKHHLDYRGLIEKGLALEAPEGMYD